MSATTTPSFSRHASSSHYTPRGGRGGGGGRRGGTRGGAANSGTPRGRFEHNTWYCDCREGEKNLLLPAERFRVKKEGPNKGRWFYVCQRKPGDERRCGFFLWEEDAKARMEGAVLAAGRSEEEGQPQRGPQKQLAGGGGDVGGVSGLGVGKAAGGGGAATTGGAAAKRKWQEEVDGEASTTEDEDDEDEYGWGKDVGVEDAIGRAVDAVSTPSRKVLKRNEGATPGGCGAMVMTPVSQRGNGGAKATPKSVRISATTPPTGGGGGDDDAGDALVPDVLEVLNENGVNLDKETCEALQKVLKSHTLRTQGLARGRDISRLAVRERNAKIGELQARVTALEAELETQKAVIANLNWQKETGQFD
ncbi:hypothetical protein SLS58_000705 [Diplodia intermedia]|uniref:GRF-type domain-containing protein n=1 Tax=Diplodia intermedia TaxID=856260 RepID=A0ABR3U4Y9_9PEZI